MPRIVPGNSAWELYWQSQIYTKQNWQSHCTGNLKSTQKRKKNFCWDNTGNLTVLAISNLHKKEKKTFVEIASTSQIYTKQNLSGDCQYFSNLHMYNVYMYICYYHVYMYTQIYTKKKKKLLLRLPVLSQIYICIMYICIYVIIMYICILKSTYV